MNFVIAKIVALKILLYSLIFTIMISFVNDRIIKWGFSLYLPGLFFLIPSIYLNFQSGFIICIIIGFFLDTIYNSPFGFHSISLTFFQIIGRMYLQDYVNNKVFRTLFIQCIANCLMLIILFLAIKLSIWESGEWSLGRFTIDIVLSSSILLALAYWQIEFVIKILKIKKTT